MDGAPEVLPDDVEELKRTVVSQHKQIVLLEEEIRLLREKFFGRKADRWSNEDVRQGRLFNEAELGSQETTEEAPEPQVIPVAPHTRAPRSRGRKPLPANLPREEIVHDIPEEHKVCACGAALSRIGEETSEQLKIIPPKLVVVRHIRPKYACRSCQGVESQGESVKIAEPPAQLLPKSIATVELLAYLMASKFVDALPFYRQERLFARIGVDLSRATMCRWAVEVAEKLQPMMKLFADNIRAGPYVQIDETTIQVLEEPGRKAESQSYMWLYRGGEIGKPVLVYQYFPSRSGDIPFEFLQDFRGYVQTDGYAGYNKLGGREGITMLGCWAHVRRKFVDVTKVTSAGRAAHDVLELIGSLYEVEHAAQRRRVEAEELMALRQEKSLPILSSIRSMLESLNDQTPPQGLLGKAVHYALGQWERLIRYCEDGRLYPDNNLAENGIRPFVLGRKNWMFAATPAGAHASATLFSILETAKASGHEPYWYLRFLFSRLIGAQTTEDYAALLPQNVRPDLVIRGE